MAKKKKEAPSLLSKEQEKQLQDMVNDMLGIAGDLVEEYKEDLPELEDLHMLSGSITQIHEGSPFLNEIFKGDAWKRVMANLPPIPQDSEEDKDASEWVYKGSRKESNDSGNIKRSHG